MNRVYPLRLSRTIWKIPLFCKHICTDNMCSNSIYYEQNDANNLTITIEENMGGKCELNECIVSTYIHLYSYNLSNPCGHIGSLFQPDNVVIPDNEFRIYIDFPLNNPIDLGIRAQGNDQTFTLRELIYLIKLIYMSIYTEEELTSTSNTFTITSPCSCINIELSTLITDNEIESDKEMENCCICYTNYQENNQSTTLNCGHTFHKECILIWISKGRGVSCPLCRKMIQHCSQCNNTKIIEYQREYKVLPVEYRIDPLRRNQTDGIYGIYGWDFEGLVLETMIYNRKLKRLMVGISTV